MNLFPSRARGEGPARARIGAAVPGDVTWAILVQRVHFPLVHIDIVDGRVWIEKDNAQSGVASELVQAGIPKSQIAVAFRSPETRELAENAVAGARFAELKKKKSGVFFRIFGLKNPDLIRTFLFSRTSLDSEQRRRP